MIQKFTLFLLLIIPCFFLLHCEMSDDLIEVMTPPLEPLPPSTFVVTVDTNTYEATIDSASLNVISSTKETMNVSFNDDSVTVFFLLQQGPGILFNPGEYSFTHATRCQREIGLCANIVVSTEVSSGGVKAKASRFEGNTLNVSLEIADIRTGGRVKGSLSGQISAFDNAPQQNISGVFDLYIERE